MRVLFKHRLAALSKPRCGSTSLRRMLNPHMGDGDLKCDVGGADAPLHPHITAPYLRQVLANMGHDADSLTYIITVRHPVELLWSYWKFFKPDAAGRYSFSKEWAGQAEMSFEDWVHQGKLALNPNWLALAPEWISRKDLSPLSLEARGMYRDGRLAVDHVFKLEEPERLTSFLSERLEREVPLKQVNASSEDKMPDLAEETLARIRRLFPGESELYEM